MRRVERITVRELVFVEGDIRDRDFLDRLFEKWQVYAVIHFARLKAVGESMEQPLAYYENNVTGTVTFC